MGDLTGMVLCAGLGTRLRPLTGRLPKPAVPVAGVPLVGWSLALLAEAGARRAVVNVHHLPDVMATVAADAAAALGLSLAVSREPVIAGTGGALREARALLAGGEADAVVVVNGDILFDLDLGAAVAAHRASGALATMVLLPMPAGASYAAVEVDGAGAVRRIAGKFGPGGEGLTPWHFSGVHVLSRALLAEVPAEPFELDVNRHVYPALMAAGAVRGWVASGWWNDLGTPARYLEANRAVLTGAFPPARFRRVDPRALGVPLAPGVWVDPAAVVHPGARLHGPLVIRAGAELDAGAEVGPEVVVGAARIRRGARVRRAVVWDATDVRAGERLEDVVAAGEDRVPAAG